MPLRERNTMSNRERESELNDFGNIQKLREGEQRNICDAKKERKVS